MKRLFFAIIVLMFIGAILFSGCSDDDDDNGNGAGTPTVDITSPATGDTVAFPQPISASVSDDGTIVRVEFCAAGEIIEVDTIAPYEAYWEMSVDSGEAIIEVCATDDAENEGCAQTTVFVPVCNYDFRLYLVTKSSHSAYLAWNRTSGTNSYEIYMSQTDFVDSTCQIADMISHSASDTTLLVDNLQSMQQYRFIVYAVGAFDARTVSNEYPVITEDVPFSHHDDGAELVSISMGEFTRGDVWLVGGNEESPDTAITLSSYDIYKYEVTCEQYRQFIDAGGYSNPEWWDSAGWMWKETVEEEVITLPMTWNDPDHFCGDAYPDYPVTGVSWWEARAYGNFVGRKLPTEAQWECTARGREGEDITGDGVPDGHKFPWGTEFFENETFHCNFKSGVEDSYDDGYEKTCPIDAFPDDVSTFGVVGMAGNVQEWCLDWYEPLYYNPVYFPDAPLFDPEGPDTSEENEKVVRGGPYINDSGGGSEGFFFRTTKRWSKSREERKKYIGFRLVEQ